MKHYDFPNEYLDVDFTVLSRREALAYFDALMKIFPERMAYLQQVVRADGKHKGWRANFSMRSLEPLREWFARQVKAEKIPERERSAMLRHSRASVPSKYRNIIKVERSEMPSSRPDHRTKCISFDVGLYVCEVIRRRSPGATWRLFPRGRSFVGFQEPVVGPLPDGMYCHQPGLGAGLAQRALAKRIVKDIDLSVVGGLDDYIVNCLKPFVWNPVPRRKRKAPSYRNG